MRVCATGAAHVWMDAVSHPRVYSQGSTVDLAKILKLKGIAQGEQDKIMEAAYQMSASASEGAKKIKKLFNAT